MKKLLLVLSAVFAMNAQASDIFDKTSIGTVLLTIAVVGLGHEYKAEIKEALQTAWTKSEPGRAEVKRYAKIGLDKGKKLARKLAATSAALYVTAKLCTWWTDNDKYERVSVGALTTLVLSGVLYALDKASAWTPEPA